MPTQAVSRRSTLGPNSPGARANAAAIFVDSDDNKLYVAPDPDNATTVYEVASEGAANNMKGGLTGADTSALVAGGGTSTTPLAMGSTAGQNLLGWWATTASTSGDERLLYTRLFFTGAGVSGETQRIFATVDNVAAATVRGAHISLSFTDAGRVTGLGAALETTLHISNGATVTGTISPLKVAINSDGASSDPANATISYIQLVNQGNTTGDDDVDDDASLFHLQGTAIGAGHTVAAVQTGYTEAEVTHGIKINIDGTLYYVLLSNVAPNAT